DPGSSLLEPGGGGTLPQELQRPTCLRAAPCVANRRYPVAPELHLVRVALQERFGRVQRSGRDSLVRRPRQVAGDPLPGECPVSLPKRQLAEREVQAFVLGPHLEQLAADQDRVVELLQLDEEVQRAVVALRRGVQVTQKSPKFSGPRPDRTRRRSCPQRSESNVQ